MLTTNPFVELAASVSPALMQAYVVVMIALVVAGTLADVVHKGSAKYFFDAWRKGKTRGGRAVGGGEVASIALHTAVVDVMTSGEFCSTKRRLAHLLTMYGFVIYLVTTVIMVFAYTDPAASTPDILPILWTLGAFMVCLGGYWFWFFIRVDVAAEGNAVFRIVRADLFVLSLTASTTFALLWAYTQADHNVLWANIFLGLYLIATTVLFGTIPWSKFAHMFFKPAAALQKRVEQASGLRRNLPLPADKPATFGSARRRPNHY
jgi:hypothetical protein